MKHESTQTQLTEMLHQFGSAAEHIFQLLMIEVSLGEMMARDVEVSYQELIKRGNQEHIEHAFNELIEAMERYHHYYDGCVDYSASHIEEAPERNHVLFDEE